MKKSNTILIFLFSLLGIIAIYMGLNVDLKCAEAAVRDNLLAGLPLWIFGIYCLITSLFLWKKPQIGNILAVFTIIMASVLILAPIFDLSFPIIKTSCSVL
jgi:hypothetical protein